MVASRGFWARVGAWALLASSIAAVAYARPRVVASLRAVKATSDVFALPPPSMLAAFSLGYRSALADLLYTSTVISVGQHFEERRRFEFVGQYLDSIVALDPHFCQTYRYADTFITYQPFGSPSADDMRHARRLLEQGLEMCPTDGHLWLSAGQFLAQIAVQYLTDDEEKDAFRVAGAKMLARAGELVSDNQNVQWQSLNAATIFSSKGQREAEIAFLERMYSLTDDEAIKTNVASKLRPLLKQQEFELQRRAFEQAKRHDDVFNQVWQRDLPFVSRSGLLVVGPPYEPARCAGSRPSERGCARSWAEWPFADAAP
jgi:hypothetical protein